MNRAARLVGKDNDDYEFIMPSFTDKNAEYSIFVSKRDGSIICKCKDSHYRGKENDLVNPITDKRLACKHSIELHHQFGEALKP